MCKQKKLRFSFHNEVIGMNANIASDDSSWGWRLQFNKGLETQLKTTGY